ncbi:MAG: 1-deoxy-D-xylulose-5-phosphate synthase [Nitrospinota bacterium]
MDILDKIDSPADLKKIQKTKLPKLADELRRMIVGTVSKNGGHLSSNLGVIELTIALNYVFNFPRDKVVWDVGHQSYAHKLLTGRRKLFHTLRQDGGIAGFPRREESPYDVFNTGHSGTSISAALGMAKARDMRGDDNSVIAVIGDGSLSSGLAFEGLNNAGSIKSNLIVVLNDNEMSISPNVGAMSAHLSSIITGERYNKLKKDIESVIKAIPAIGEQIASFAHKLDDGIKGMFIPGRLFEDLGFKYVGPIDGHNINLLIDTLKKVRKLERPILLHIVTKKGLGYLPAEERPDNYHGTPPFDASNGNFNREPSYTTYTKAFGEALVHLAGENEKVVAITAAMMDGTGLKDFAERFPERFYDVGIAEQHAVTFAAGLATEGFKPVVAVYSTFLQRAYDQILHDVCQMNLPVIFAIDRAGIVGEDGPTHQGMFDISYLRSLPNMTIMAPKDENELGQMLGTALTIEGPVAIRYPRGSGVGVEIDKEYKKIPVGQGEILREGTDCAILAVGNRVYPSLEAAKMLEEKGISCAVINLRFVKPLDRELIKEMSQKVKCIVTVEEHLLMGGAGSGVLELLDDLFMVHPPILRIGVDDCFVEHANPDLLRERYQLDANGIFKQTLNFFNKCQKKHA